MHPEVYVYGAEAAIDRLRLAIEDPTRITFLRWGKPSDDGDLCAVFEVKHYAVDAIEEAGPRYNCEVYL